MGLISRVSSRTYRKKTDEIRKKMTSKLTISLIFLLVAISSSTPLDRLARDTARLPMKRGSNSWTINSLGYHGGLGQLFDVKAKRAFQGQIPIQENKRSLFPKLETRSVNGGDYDEFVRDDVMRAAEAELIRRGYNLY